MFRRASCHIAQQQHDEAKRDLDILLTVDPENNEAKVRFFFLLLNTKLINEIHLF